MSCKTERFALIVAQGTGNEIWPPFFFLIFFGNFSGRRTKKIKIIFIELYRYHLNQTSGYCSQRPCEALTLISGILQIRDPPKKKIVALPAFSDLQL